MNLLSILGAIYKYEGRRVPQYVKTTKLTSEKTMEKYIKLLREAKLIEFKRASRTGGYYFSKEIIKLLKKS